MSLNESLCKPKTDKSVWSKTAGLKTFRLIGLQSMFIHLRSFWVATTVLKLPHYVTHWHRRIYSRRVPCVCEHVKRWYFSWIIIVTLKVFKSTDDNTDLPSLTTTFLWSPFLTLAQVIVLYSVNMSPNLFVAPSSGKTMLTLDALINEVFSWRRSRGMAVSSLKPHTQRRFKLLSWAWYWLSLYIRHHDFTYSFNFESCLLMVLGQQMQNSPFMNEIGTIELATHKGRSMLNMDSTSTSRIFFMNNLTE